MVHRRMRVHVRAVVMPSPVGLAMLWVNVPSPFRPKPAVEGPFLTNSVQFITLPILVKLATFF